MKRIEQPTPNTRQQRKKEQQLKYSKPRLIAKNYVLADPIAAVVIVLFATFYRKRVVAAQDTLQAEVMKQQDRHRAVISAVKKNERKRIATPTCDGVGQMTERQNESSAFETEIDFRNESQKTAFEN